MNWYTLRVISGKEEKIKENILFELDFQKLSSEVEGYYGAIRKYCWDEGRKEEG